MVLAVLGLRVGSRVYDKRDYYSDTGTIVSIRRSDGIYSSGQLRCRGSLFATVQWDHRPKRGSFGSEYALSDLGDLDAQDDEKA